MEWNKLLSRHRLFRNEKRTGMDARTSFQRDYDRIVFSAAFRRLQDKAQVFPLAKSDYVRTRLTHSLEASCVGRSLGTMVGQRLLEEEKGLAASFHPMELGAIVAAACLAHDIGNPPFGHAGENAIGHWFRTSPYAGGLCDALSEERGATTRRELENFEGNAQGFRVLARLENHVNHGGLQLTCATLGAFVKYPRDCAGPGPPNRRNGVSSKKHGLFEQDATIFREVARETGISVRGQPGNESGGPGLVACRHPLAFLVEAADDICYHIVDIEDGYKMRLLGFDEAADLMKAVLGPQQAAVRDADRPAERRIEPLRARAINALVDQVVAAFMENQTAILAGTFDRELTSVIPASRPFARLKHVALEKVYQDPEVVEIEAAGFNVLAELLEAFIRTLNDVIENGNRAAAKSQTFRKLLPPVERHASLDSLYDRILFVTDFVSGMTDRYAVALFKRITGISLPGE